MEIKSTRFKSGNEIKKWLCNQCYYNLRFGKKSYTCKICIRSYEGLKIMFVWSLFSSLIILWRLQYEEFKLNELFS